MITINCFSTAQEDIDKDMKVLKRKRTEGVVGQAYPCKPKDSKKMGQRKTVKKSNRKDLMCKVEGQLSVVAVAALMIFVEWLKSRYLFPIHEQFGNRRIFA
jgi:hypothetical protein